MLPFFLLRSCLLKKTLQAGQLIWMIEISSLLLQRVLEFIYFDSHFACGLMVVFLVIWRIVALSGVVMTNDPGWTISHSMYTLFYSFAAYLL